jgi:HIV Tat-specific factor 1
LKFCSLNPVNAVVSLKEVAENSLLGGIRRFEEKFNMNRFMVLMNQGRMPYESTSVAVPKKRQSTPKNTAVYVSNLPNDVTVNELVEYFSKCGIIMDEIMTGKPRVKLYSDQEGNLKGDALIVYLREESVTLALNILDEGEIRPGHKIRVQEASFNSNNTNETPAGEQEIKRNKVDKETWKKHMRKMQK